MKDKKKKAGILLMVLAVMIIIKLMEITVFEKVFINRPKSTHGISNMFKK